MKVFFDKIFQLDQNYQEVLIDKNEFRDVDYLLIRPSRQNVNGILYDDIYIIEPLSYYEIILKKNVPGDFKNFYPSRRILEAGLIFAGVCRDKPVSIFMYNCTHNNIFLKEDAAIGEVSND